MAKESVNEKLDEFFEYTAKFAQKYPEIGSNFMTLMGSIIQDGKLKSKEKELIALAVGLSVQCMPCIILHVQKALKAGATREDILEAAGVVVMMCGGPAYTHVPEVMKAMDELQG